MLTDAQCRNATCSPGAKRERYADSGGLYLEVSPAGSRRWFWKYRKDGKEGRLALGNEQSWHGFRASARTMMVDQLDLDPLAIEANLAHAVKDSNGRSYNRTKYLAKRFEQIQQWADY